MALLGASLLTHAGPILRSVLGPVTRQCLGAHLSMLLGFCEH
jgi:hypothetical protein